MNHKFHNTILASAVVGATFLFGLLAAQPIGHSPASGGRASHRAAGAAWGADVGHEWASDIELRARAFEIDPASAASAGGALARASALLATSMVETTVASVLEDIGTRQSAARRATLHHDARPARHRPRGALAMPYFSSAQVVRRGDQG